MTQLLSYSVSVSWPVGAEMPEQPVIWASVVWGTLAPAQLEPNVPVIEEMDLAQMEVDLARWPNQRLDILQ